MHFPYILQTIIDEIRSMADEGIVAAHLTEKDLNEMTSIAELSLDSLGKMQLITAVEDKADVLLGDGDLYNVQTLGDLARVVVDALPAAA